MREYELKHWDYISTRFDAKKKKKKKATASEKYSPIVWDRISFKTGFGDLKSEIQYTILFFLLAYLVVNPVLV